MKRSRFGSRATPSDRAGFLRIGPDRTRIGSPWIGLGLGSGPFRAPPRALFSSVGLPKVVFHPKTGRTPRNFFEHLFKLFGRGRFRPPAPGCAFATPAKPGGPFRAPPGPFLASAGLPKAVFHPKTGRIPRNFFGNLFELFGRGRFRAQTPGCAFATPEKPGGPVRTPPGPFLASVGLPKAAFSSENQ